MPLCSNASRQLWLFSGISATLQAPAPITAGSYSRCCLPQQQSMICSSGSCRVVAPVYWHKTQICVQILLSMRTWSFKASSHAAGASETPDVPYFDAPERQEQVPQEPHGTMETLHATTEAPSVIHITPGTPAAAGQAAASPFGHAALPSEQAPSRARCMLTSTEFQASHCRGLGRCARLQNVRLDSPRGNRPAEAAIAVSEQGPY
jgi:hypothetical protein